MTGSVPRKENNPAVPITIAGQVTTRGNWVLVRTLDDRSIGYTCAEYLGAAAEN